MHENVCLFVPYNSNTKTLNVVNFVLETKPQPFSSLKTYGLYKAHYVIKGTGNLHIMGKIIPLSPNDVFFTFPSLPYCIESKEDFAYIYISFLGTRTNMMFDKLDINHHNFLFHDCHELCGFCQKNIYCNPEISDWISESILLYTFSYLGSHILSPEGNISYKNNTAFIIKKYIDDNFSASDLSLNTISVELSYSPKYISTTFKKAFDTGVNEYINTLRMQHAYTLMQQGFTSISDISAQCGFSDAQYFSKVFKKKMGYSPKEYILRFT